MIEPNEIRPILSFFHENIGREVTISLSFFDGFSEHQVARITDAGHRNEHGHHVHLASIDNHRRFEIDLDHYSFVTISRDHNAVELRKLLNSGGTFGLVVSLARKEAIGSSR